MLKQFYDDILSGRITIKQSKDEQNEINEEISDLEDYKPANRNKIKEKSKVYENARNFLDERKKIIEAFEKGIFLMPEKVLHKSQIEKQSEKQSENERKKYVDRAVKEVYRVEEGFVDRDMFHKYFGYKTSSAMFAKLTKSNRENNISLVVSVEENLNKLRKDRKNTSDSFLIVSDSFC